MKKVIAFASLCTLTAVFTHAAIIGSEDFNSYADGAIAEQAGGTGWNWDNTGKSNTVTSSAWSNVGGTPQVASGALLTSGSSSNTFRLRGGNSNSWSYDEIRFGTDWRSVLPLSEDPEVIQHPKRTLFLIN